MKSGLGGLLAAAVVHDSLLKALKEARDVARTSRNCTDEHIERWNEIIRRAEG